MEGLKRQWCRNIFTWLLAVLILFIVGAFKQPREPEVTAQVLKVHPSPGVWSGIAISLQWIDITSEKSSFSEIKPGMNLRIGVPLIKGNFLFDQYAQFSPQKIAAGKLIRIKFSKMCANPHGTGAYVIEPDCIVTLK